MSNSSDFQQNAWDIPSYEQKDQFMIEFSLELGVDLRDTAASSLLNACCVTASQQLNRPHHEIIVIFLKLVECKAHISQICFIRDSIVVGKIRRCIHILFFCSPHDRK